MRPYFCPIMNRAAWLAKNVPPFRHREIVILNRHVLGGVSSAIPALFTKVIERPKCATPSIMHRALNLIEVGHIHLQRDDTAPHRADLVGQPRIRMKVPQPQCHVCPGVCKRQKIAQDRGLLL